MRWITFSLLSLLLMSPGLRAEDAVDTSAAPAANEAVAAESKAAETDSAAASDAGSAATDTQAAKAATADASANASAATSAEANATADATDDASTTASSAAAPMDTERLIVSSVAGAIALAGLATGVTFGVMALNQYNCLSDISTCNKTQDPPIEGSAYLDAKESVERNALYADMGYLVAATAATVAIVGAVELLFGSEAEVAE